MKNILTLFVALLCICSISTNAQTLDLKSTVGYVVDTVTNTGAKTQKIAVRNYAPVGLIQVVVTKISGTVGGKAFLYGSANGTDFVKIDSLVIANVDNQTKIFDVSPVKYSAYQVTYTGAGTMSAKIRSTLAVKK